MRFYVNVHIWDWEISVFAQMHKPKLGDHFSLYCSDGCIANIFMVQPSKSFSPNFLGVEDRELG